VYLRRELVSQRLLPGRHLRDSIPRDLWGCRLDLRGVRHALGQLLGYGRLPLRRRSGLRGRPAVYRQHLRLRRNILSRRVLRG
jgi:hypothetical protein